MLPFELISILLLAALTGSALLARKKNISDDLEENVESLNLENDNDDIDENSIDSEEKNQSSDDQESKGEQPNG